MDSEMGKFATLICPSCGEWARFSIGVDMLGNTEIRIGCEACEHWEAYFGNENETNSLVEQLYQFMKSNRHEGT